MTPPRVVPARADQDVRPGPRHRVAERVASGRGGVGDGQQQGARGALVDR